MGFFTFRFGKNKEGKAVRSRSNGPWHIMPGVEAEQVKTCSLEVWTYEGQFKGKTLKEICATDAEYLDMMIDLMHKNSKHMPCARILLMRKK